MRLRHSVTNSQTERSNPVQTAETSQKQRERRFSQEVSGDATLVVSPLLVEGVVIFLIVNYISTPPPLLLSLAQIRESEITACERERVYLPRHYLY